jgi:hypothetical protein
MVLFVFNAISVLLTTAAFDVYYIYYRLHTFFLINFNIQKVESDLLK